MNIAARSAQASALLLVLLFPPTWSAAVAQNTAASGVLWETTSQVTMEGMPFGPPPQTHKLCAPVEWTEPPSADNDDRGCVNSAFERDELTVTWTSTCAGPPEMAGQGEIVFEDDTAQAYSGKIEYSSDDGIVVIVLGGKVIGSCDNPR